MAGAGYSSKPPGALAVGRAGVLTDASGRALGPAPPLAERADSSPEEQARAMERRVHAQLESAADAAARGDFVLSLERAKEAGRKERALSKFREAGGMGDAISPELAYAVGFALGEAYERNKLWPEALNTYSLIVKNKAFAGAARLRCNMGE